MRDEQKDLDLLQDAAKKLEKPNFAAIQDEINSKKVIAFKPKRNRRIWAQAAAVAAVLVFAVGITFAYNYDMLPTAGGTKEYQEVFDALKLTTINGNTSYGVMYEEMESAAMADDAAAPQSSESLSGAATASKADGGSYGETNVQVEGVDEADIVKNDGENLYVLSDYYDGSYNRIQMISVVRISDMTLLSQTDLQADTNSSVADMYVKNGRLITLGALYRDSTDHPEYANGISNLRMDFLNGETIATIYEINADGTLQKVRQFTQDGNYLSSRLTGDMLYIISANQLYLHKAITYDDIEAYLPHTSDTGDDSMLKPVTADCIQITQDPDSVFTTVSSLPITGHGEAFTQSVLGSSGNTVYSSQDNLYVAGYAGEEVEILKYALQNGNIEFQTRNTVPGYVNNQFSMDEYDGKLRIATTNYKTGKAENKLYVLNETLEIIGESESLAPGETIQSVRFMGGMAYVVTFLQRDPLFAIDVSDPYNPTVMGQLKIPGFSSYMHPLDETTLIGIGFDADEDTGWTTGLKFSLFDVSDPLNPIESNKIVLTGDCYSEATYNHKAVTFIREKGLLVLPIELYGDVTFGGNTIAGKYTGSALVLHVAKDTGFTFKGIITDEQDSQDYQRFIRRSTYWNDRLLTVSLQAVIAVDMDSLSLISQLELYDKPAEPDETYQTEPSYPESGVEIEPYTVYD